MGPRKRLLLATLPVVTMLGVQAAVLGSALLHAAWNAAAHRIPDRAVGIALIGAAYTAVSLVLVPWVGVPAAGAWPYLAGSVLVQTVYCLLLVRSYQLGDFNQAYPLARGTSPLLVFLVAVTVLREPLRVGQAVGIAVLCAGLAVLVFAGGVTRASRSASTAAVATGVSIAVYTVLDGLGARAADNTAAYVCWLFLLQGPLVVGLVAVRRRGRLLRAGRDVWLVGLASGVVSLAAYATVVWAQTRIDLPTVAALREVSILFGALIGVTAFREPFGAGRVAGAGLAAAGIAMLNL